MISRILALALSLALAIRFIEYACSVKARADTLEHNIKAVLTYFSALTLVLYICFLVLVAPSKVSRMSARELSKLSMAEDVRLVGGGRLGTVPEPIVWPSVDELAQAICNKVETVHVPSTKDF